MGVSEGDVWVVGTSLMDDELVGAFSEGGS